MKIDLSTLPVPIGVTKYGHIVTQWKDSDGVIHQQDIKRGCFRGIGARAFERFAYGGAGGIIYREILKPNETQRTRKRAQRDWMRTFFDYLG